MDLFEDTTSYDQFELAYSDALGSWANFLWENGIDITSLEFESRRNRLDHRGNTISVAERVLSISKKHTSIAIFDAISPYEHFTNLKIQKYDLMGETMLELTLRNGEAIKFGINRTSQGSIHMQEIKIDRLKTNFSIASSLKIFDWQIRLNQRVSLDIDNPNLGRAMLDGIIYYLGNKYGSEPKVLNSRKKSRIVAPLYIQLALADNKPPDLRPNNLVKYLQAEGLMVDYLLEQHGNDLSFKSFEPTNNTVLNIKVQSVEQVLKNFIIPANYF